MLPTPVFEAVVDLLAALDRAIPGKVELARVRAIHLTRWRAALIPDVGPAQALVV
jgi:hypothetical protein